MTSSIGERSGDEPSGRPAIRAAFLPRAGMQNPLQHLIMEGIRRAGIEAVYGVDRRLFAATLTSLRRRPDFIQYDWNYRYYLARSRRLASLLGAAFRADLRIARRLLGARIVFTLHNIQSHEPLHLDYQRDMQRWFAARCEWIRVFSRSSIVRAVRYLDVAPERLRVVPMGSYIGVYADTVGRAEARRKLGLPDDAKVLLNLGLIRGYKGLPTFIEGVRRLADPSLHVLIVGPASSPEVVARLREMVGDDRRVHLRPEFVPEDEVQYYARAADAMVLPYEEIENSSAGALAMAFALPVIAPRIGVLPEMLSAQPELLYERGGLEPMLARAQQLDVGELAAIGRRNFEAAQRLRWEDFAAPFREPKRPTASDRRAPAAGVPAGLRRTAVRTAIAAASLGGRSRRRITPGGPPRVLSWHNVLPTEWLGDGAPYAMDHGITLFERQLEWLSREYRVLPAAAALEPSSGDGRAAVVLSFDDGMLAAAEIVAPLLEQRGMTGIFAIVGSVASGERPHLWSDELYLLLRERIGTPTLLPTDDFRAPVVPSAATLAGLLAGIRRRVGRGNVQDIPAMIDEMRRRNGIAAAGPAYRPLRFTAASADRLAEMRRAGHVIASHGWSHRNLRSLPADERQRELARSREWLASVLGEPVRWVVYPYGGEDAVDEAVATDARDAGYEAGFMNVDRPSANPWMRPRVPMPRVMWAPELRASIDGLRGAWLGRRGRLASSDPSRR